VRTRSGKLAREVTITAGGKWRFCRNCATLTAAETEAATHRAKGRKTRITPRAKGGYQVHAYIARHRQIMQHVNAEDD
jgi:hypothetical protein